MKLSIIIPAHNEEKRISKTLEDYGGFFPKKYRKNVEIIAVLNGCEDNTLSVVKKFRKKYSQIKYLDFKRAGKGFAIIEGFKAAKGDLVGFTDADGSTSAKAFYDLVLNIKNYDGIIASRWIKGAVIRPKQPFFRRIASRIFNVIIRVLFGFKFRDTQCGAKIFKKTSVKSVLPKLGVTEWAFDIDLLYQMKKMNFKIKEVPTIWKDSEGSRLNVSKTSIRMLLSIVQLRIIHSSFRRLLRPFKPLVRTLYRFTK